MLCVRINKIECWTVLWAFYKSRTAWHHNYLKVCLLCEREMFSPQESSGGVTKRISKHDVKAVCAKKCSLRATNKQTKKYTSVKAKKEKSLTSLVRSCWPGHCESPTGQEFPPHDIITNVYKPRVLLRRVSLSSGSSRAVIKSSSQHTISAAQRAMRCRCTTHTHSLSLYSKQAGGQRAIPIHSVHLLFNLFCCNPLSVGGTNERKMTSLLSNQRRTAAMNLRLRLLRL
jgi:hypothetical protein